jgi:nucleoside-diphosphate-sugar epimerase
VLFPRAQKGGALMRILIAGATGAIGRPLVPILVRSGHAVTGVTHTPAKTELLHQLGAEPMVLDALDEVAVHRAVETVRPDVIVHEMTELKGTVDLRHFDRTFARSNRLRTVGTDYLLAAGVRRFIAQSFCGWPFARTGEHVKSEEAALDPDPPREMRRTLDAIRHVEQAVTASTMPRGVALRYGTFYGPGTGMGDPAFVDQVRRRRVPLIGGGTGWWSFVHVADAAEATALAIERGEGIYNIVDDDPAPVHEWLPAIAAMLGANRPFRVPAWAARLLAGEHLVVMMTESRAGSNAKAKRELDWQPRHPSWREGLAEILGEGRLAA